MKNDDIKNDLISVFIQNQKNTFLIPVLASLIFLGARIYTYGFPVGNELYGFVVLVLLSLTAYISQFSVFKKAREGTLSLEKIEYTIFLNRVGYVLPFLIILFWPINTNFLFDHITGFAFILLSIGYCITLSTANQFIFKATLALYLACSLAVSFINFNTVDTPFVILGFVVFTVFAGFIGQKLHQSSRLLTIRNIELEQATKMAEKANCPTPYKGVQI